MIKTNARLSKTISFVDRALARRPLEMDSAWRLEVATARGAVPVVSFETGHPEAIVEVVSEASGEERIDRLLVEAPQGLLADLVPGEYVGELLYCDPSNGDGEPISFAVFPVRIEAGVARI